MVLAVGLALILLAAAAVGLRVAAGPEPIPLPDREMVPYPGASLPTAPYTVDTTPPGLLVDDVNGQFRVTVPRTWPIDPNPEPDRTSWMPPVRLATGGLAQAGFTFTVRWGTSSGCTLEACAMRALDALLAQNPASPSLQPDSIGGLDAIRLEAIFSNKLVVAWVVVKEDRYWTILLSGPPDGFDDMLAFVRTIVVSMSFG